MSEPTPEDRERAAKDLLYLTRRSEVEVFGTEGGVRAALAYLRQDGMTPNTRAAADRIAWALGVSS